MAKFNKAKKKPKKKWWIIHTKNYSYHIIALPLIPFCLLTEKIEKKAYAKRVWSEEKATKVLNKILPKVLEWNEEDQAFWYCMQWSEYTLYSKAPLRYKKWVRKFRYQLQKFIKTGYENPHYIKSVEEGSYGYETWIKFVEKK